MSIYMNKTQKKIYLTAQALNKLDQLKAVNNLSYTDIIEILILNQKKLNIKNR